MKAFNILFVLVIACLFVAVYAKKACLYGINYSPRNGPDWAPPATKCKSYSAIVSDLKALKKITSRIRIYSLTDCNQADLMLQAAEAVNMKLWIGLWVSSNPTVFNDEFAKFKSLVQTGKLKSDRILGVHVGSEALYRKDVDLATLIKYFTVVKDLMKQNPDLSKIPVTIADTIDPYLQYFNMTESLDMISVNAFPFWEKLPAQGAINNMTNRMIPLLKKAKTLPNGFLLSETGWASGASNSNASVASPENQATYLTDVWCKLHVQRQWKYYYYSGIDADFFKTIPDKEVEAHFGLFTTNLQLKPNIAELKMKCPDSTDTWQFSTADDCPIEKESSTPPDNNYIDLKRSNNSTSTSTKKEATSSDESTGSTTSSLSSEEKKTSTRAVDVKKETASSSSVVVVSNICMMISLALTGYLNL